MWRVRVKVITRTVFVLCCMCFPIAVPEIGLFVPCFILVGLVTYTDIFQGLLFEEQNEALQKASGELIETFQDLKKNG